MMNKPIEQWTLSQVDEFLSNSGMMDLGHLSLEEKLQIIRVLKRDERLLHTESNRVLKLRQEVQDLKRKGAIKTGNTPSPSTVTTNSTGGGTGAGGGSDHGGGGGGVVGGVLDGKLCARCQSELGLILNRGEECFKCHFMVCKQCRVVVTEDGKTWLCILCAKQAKLRTISGEWFYEKVSERLKPQNASHIHASNVIRDSIRLKKNHSSAGNSPVAVKRGMPVQVGGNAQGHHVIQQATTVSPRHHPKSRTLSASASSGLSGSIRDDGNTNSTIQAHFPTGGSRNSRSATGGMGIHGYSGRDQELHDDSSDNNLFYSEELAKSQLCAEIERGLLGMHWSNEANEAALSNPLGSSSTPKTTTNNTGPGASNTTSQITNQLTPLYKSSSSNPAATSPFSSADDSMSSEQLTKSLPNYSNRLAAHLPTQNQANSRTNSPVSSMSNQDSTKSLVQVDSSKNRLTSPQQRHSQDSLSSEGSTATLGASGCGGTTKPKTSRYPVAAGAAMPTQSTFKISSASLGTGPGRRIPSESPEISDSSSSHSTKHTSADVPTPSSRLPFNQQPFRDPNRTDQNQNEDMLTSGAGTLSNSRRRDLGLESAMRPQNMSTPNLRAGYTHRVPGSGRKGMSSRSPSGTQGREGHAVPPYPHEHWLPRKEMRGRGGHMVPHYAEFYDPYTMPYMHPRGMRPSPVMATHYYMDASGSLNRMRGRPQPMPRYPGAPGFYPIDNTHQMILHKVELLNKHTRRKFLMAAEGPGWTGGEEQFGSPSSFATLQEYVDNRDNSEHAATLSSESERSHRSHHVDDDLEDPHGHSHGHSHGQRRTEADTEGTESQRGSLLKQNSSDNYEHEQPNRRRSLQGGHSQDSQTSGNTNTNNPNVTQTTHGNLGSNNSLHATNLDIGTSRPIGYSCSVPATPEHRRYHAAANASDWASMSYSGGGRPMPHPHQEYADMGMGGRGGMRGVPYGYRPRHPHHRYGGASNSQGRIPFRHPSQYRSMPPHAYGFYQQGGRPRPRHMAPLYASARFASQEDFRGSSKSLALYPNSNSGSEFNSPHTTHGMIGGSRESLLRDSGDTREGRSLSKSSFVGGDHLDPRSKHHQQQQSQPRHASRSSSMPPCEDRLGGHLGEGEGEGLQQGVGGYQHPHQTQPQQLNSSSNVPSLINSLTSSRHATFESTTTTTADATTASTKSISGDDDILRQRQQARRVIPPHTAPAVTKGGKEETLTTPTINTPRDHNTHTQPNSPIDEHGKDKQFSSKRARSAQGPGNKTRSISSLDLLLSEKRPDQTETNSNSISNEHSLGSSWDPQIYPRMNPTTRSFSASTHTLIGVGLEDGAESYGGSKSFKQHKSTSGGGGLRMSWKSLRASQNSLPGSKESLKEKLRRSGKRFGSQINRLSGRSGSRGDEREEHEVDGRERKRDQEKDKEVSRTKTKPKTANGVKRVQLTDVELKNSKGKDGEEGRANEKMRQQESVLGSVGLTAFYDQKSNSVPALQLKELSCVGVSRSNSSSSKHGNGPVYLRVSLIQIVANSSGNNTSPQWSSQETVAQQITSLSSLSSSLSSFPETLKFVLHSDQIESSIVSIKVCSKKETKLDKNKEKEKIKEKDKNKEKEKDKDPLLGQVEVGVDELIATQSPSSSSSLTTSVASPIAHALPLTIYAENDSKSVGWVKLTVKWEPGKRMSVRVSASGLLQGGKKGAGSGGGGGGGVGGIIKTKQPPNTFCTLRLLPMASAVWDSGEVVTKSADPVYLKTFNIPLVVSTSSSSSSTSDATGSVMSKTVNLDQVCLELAIYSTSSSSSPFSSSGSHKENKEKKENREKSGPGNSRSFLAGVRLSAGTAACNGGAVEWMQCTREERELWGRVRSSPHHWVQGHLRLRSNFAPFK